MKRYVITVAPETDGDTPTESHTTLRVDVSTGQVRITELIVRAAGEDGLTSGGVPPIDLGLLARALTAPATVSSVAEPIQSVGDGPVEIPDATSRRPHKRTTRGTSRQTSVRASGNKTVKPVKNATPSSGPRPYRRMPDPEQVMDVYRQTGSITAVADHFDVPRHTVVSWARRLRTMGHIIGR